MQYFPVPTPILADLPDPQPVVGCAECKAQSERLSATRGATLRTDLRILFRRHLEEHES